MAPPALQPPAEEEAAERSADEEAVPPPAEEAAAAPQPVKFVMAEPIYPSDEEVHIVTHSPWLTLIVPPNRI